MTKKQTSLLILLVLLFVLCLGAGIYFFLNPKNLSINVLKTDKYQELVDWCDTNTKENKLDVKCQALLLEIKVIDANNSCAEVQIISKEKELKNISICGDNNVITYSNEVLDYKKLMPIDIDLSYERADALNSFEIQNISATKVSDEYIQNIVNEDITEFVNTKVNKELTEVILDDESKYLDANEDTYVITNSIDYCPAPELLPNYISKKQEYTKFYEGNILTEADYNNISEDRLFGEVFEKLFACDSANKLGYKTCNLLKITRMPSTPSKLITLDTTEVVWNKKMDLMDRIHLKQISAIYNNMYTVKETETKYIVDLNNLISDINTKKDLSETTFCSAYKLFDSLSINNNLFDEQKKFIKSTVIANMYEVTSRLCLDIFTESEIDLQGAYLKVYFSNINNKSMFRIYNQCNNLSSIIN